MNELIKCPNCGNVFEINDALSHQIEDKLREEIEQKFFVETKKIKEQAIKEAERKYTIELIDLNDRLSEADNRLKISMDKEIEFRKLSREIEEKERLINQTIENKIDEEKKKIYENVQLDFEKKQKMKISEIELKLSESERLIQDYANRNKELIKQNIENEEKRRQFESEKQKMIDEEKNKIWYQANAKFNEEKMMIEADFNKKLEDQRRQVDEMKRKLEQGSQQTQGEVLELVLEGALKSAFPFDEIQPVPKGIRGADIIQSVRGNYGNISGTILWESKRTKKWDNGWIQKLKEDQLTVKANIAVIVTSTLPKEIDRIGNIDGVWICDFTSARGIAAVLRSGIIEVAGVQNSLVGKNEKMEILYNYFAGIEFRQRITMLLETFRSMKDELEAEKRSFSAIWAKREKQIEKMTSGTASLYGDLQGIIGNSLEPISQLELPAGENIY